MVSEYIDNICKYNLSKLENVVYLVDEEAVKSINIDNGAAYISSVSQEPIAIKCYNLKLTENESLDERYKFTHTVTFSVHGYANKDNFQDRYYVIVKDMDGTYWMLNPLFPCKVGYTYNLGYQEDHTDFTLATVSNHPVLEVKGLDLSNTFECRGYNIGGVDKLWLNEKRFTVHEGNSVKYTNDGFKEVDFKRTSGLLTETFDGDDISHSINFKIGFDYYKTSWHYNLLEFIDNIYASVVKTKGGKYTLCGFGYGLQPSYTINADDTAETPNMIDITLTDAHSDNHTLGFYDSVDYEYLSAKTWEYTSTYGGYECVSEGMAKYLLKKETDALGNETDRYMALDGYEDRFADLNIVDTFYDEVLFSSVECGGMACLIDLSFPSTMRFNQITCKDYHLRSDTDWSISSSESFITVSPTSGAANQDYTITVCNTIEPTATARTATLTVNYCNTVIQYDVVVEEGDSCFPQGSFYEISANAQTLTIPTKCCVEEVNETAGVGVVTSIYSNYITVQVPNNNAGRYRTITLLVVYCDGKSSNIIIRQSDIFEQWVNEGTICKRKDKYSVTAKYTGRTPTSITARTDEVIETLIEPNSRDCKGTDDWEKWKYVIVDGYFCDDANKYALERRYVSDNGTTWYPTDIYRKSATVLEYNSTDCCYDPKWENYPYSKYQWDGETVCNDGSKWKYYKKYFSMDGEIWEESCIMKLGTTLADLVELNAEECGYIPNGYLYRWRQASSQNDYICSGTTKYFKVYYEESTDSGTTWHYYIPLRIMLGSVIEYDSRDCTNNAVKYKVKDEYECISYDESQTNDFRYKILDSSGNTVEVGECNGNTVLYQYPATFSRDVVWSSPNADYTLIVGECINLIDFDGSNTEALLYFKNLVLPKKSLLEIRKLDGFYGYHSIEIPKTIRRLGDMVFSRLEPSSLTHKISAVTFEEGSQLETMGAIFKQGNRSAQDLITSFDIPSGVTEIVDSTFANCYNLQEINIPKTIKRLGANAFRSCSGLTSVTFDSNSELEEIGAQCFDTCKALTSIVIPKSVKKIAHHAFDGCSSLTSVTFEEGSQLKVIEQAAFGGTAMSSLTIPPSVETIDSTFGFSSNQTVIIPPNSNLKRITMMVSAVDNTKYTRIGGTIPSMVEEADSYVYPKAFGYNYGSGITAISDSDPNSNKIPTRATVTIQAQYPPYTNAMNDGFRGTIRVPSGSVELYKNNLNWYKFADYIVGI